MSTGRSPSRKSGLAEGRQLWLTLAARAKPSPEPLRTALVCTSRPKPAIAGDVNKWVSFVSKCNPGALRVSRITPERHADHRPARVLLIAPGRAT